MLGRKPLYYEGATEVVFTRMHPSVRKALRKEVTTDKSIAHQLLPRDIIEDCLVSFIKSNDYDASKRFMMRPDYQGCTYKIDKGIMKQLRRIKMAVGENIQTLINEAIARKLSVVLDEDAPDGQ